MVTGHAVERGVSAGRRILLAMAFDAPAHRQRGRRRLEAHQMQQVDRQLGPGLGRGGRHRLDWGVTRLALETRADVRLVREVRELRELVHSHPGDRRCRWEELGYRLGLWLCRGRYSGASRSPLRS